MTKKNALPSLLNFLLLFIFLFSLSSCNKEKSLSSQEEDYAWLKTSITIKPIESIDTTRLDFVSKQMNGTKSGFSEPLNSARILRAPKGLTASGLSFLNNQTVLVCYQGQNGAYTGAIEIMEVGPTGFVRLLGGLDFPEARVNNVITDKKGTRLFAALDTKNGPVLIALQTLEYSIVKESLQAIRLNGKSVNGLLYTTENGREYVYSATGGDGTSNPNIKDTVLHFDGKTNIPQSLFLAKSGFQKTDVSQSLTPIVFQGNENNRGKWISEDNGAIVTMHYSSYNQYSEASIQYYKEGIKNFHNRTIDQKGIVSWIQTTTAKNVCLLESDIATSNSAQKLLYICAGDKGLRSFSLNTSDSSARFVPVSILEKEVYAISSDKQNRKMYAACGTKGVAILSCESGILSSEKTFKYNTASANFILHREDYLYIAYGSDGVISINKDDAMFQ